MDLAAYSWNVAHGFSALVIVGQLVLLAMLVSALLRRLTGKYDALNGWVARNALTLMLVVAALATLGSLYFSEIAGWAPCKYCWIQRIFMYPQVVLLPIALWKADRGVARYVLALSLIGLTYAAYHYYIQMYDIVASPANPATPCDATGESCVKTPFVHFGYITVPMMALTAFFLNAVGSLTALRSDARRPTA